jgi:hypothetical protein
VLARLVRAFAAAGLVAALLAVDVLARFAFAGVLAAASFADFWLPAARAALLRFLVTGAVSSRAAFTARRRSVVVGALPFDSAAARVEARRRLAF